MLVTAAAATLSAALASVVGSVAFLLATLQATANGGLLAATLIGLAVTPTSHAQDGTAASESPSPSSGSVASAEVTGWWLLLEDVSSERSTLTVRINDLTVKTLSSGSAPVLVPLDGVLRRGANDVLLRMDGGYARGRMAATLSPGEQQAGGSIRLADDATRHLVQPEIEGGKRFVLEVP